MLHKKLLSYSILIALWGCGGGGGSDETVTEQPETIVEQSTDTVPELEEPTDKDKVENDNDNEVIKDKDKITIIPPVTDPESEQPPVIIPPTPSVPTSDPEPNVVITLGKMEANKQLPITIECSNCGNTYSRIGIDTDADEGFDKVVDYPDPLMLSTEDIGKKIAVWVWDDNDLVAVDSFQQVGAIGTIYAGNQASQVISNSLGEVLSWGDFSLGKDSSTFTYDYNNPVKAMASTVGAHTVLFKDNTVISFGDDYWGGDASAVASQLSNPVNAIFANAFAFAAVHDDGSVTTWGVSNNGGDSSSVDLSSSDRTRNIFTDEYGTFFAVKQSAKLVSWGSDSIPEQQLLNNDATVYSNMSSVVVNNNPFGIQCFGDVYRGGTCPSRAGTMNVKDIYYSFNSFLAVEYSGLPTVWGMNVDNYNLSDFLQPEHRVKHVATNVDGYAVLREDGTIIPIGMFSGEVDPSVINTGVKYTDVKDFRGQFIALREDGKALLWGGSNQEIITLPNGELITGIYPNAYQIAYTGDQGNVYLYNDNTDVMMKVVSNKTITKIYTSKYAFTALLSDGSATAFGEKSYGGDVPWNVDLSGNNVNQIAPIAENTLLHENKQSRLINNGKIAHWGDSSIQFD